MTSVCRIEETFMKQAETTKFAPRIQKDDFKNVALDDQQQ